MSDLLNFVAPRRNQTENGFTLLELLIVIVVLGVLAAVVIFSLGGISAKAAVAACQSDVKTVLLAVQSYSTINGAPPATLSQLTTGSTTYLQSLPSSSNYAISLSNGAVMVAAPLTTTPVAASSPNACAAAGSSTATTTTTTTTTTTLPPSNGVTAATRYTHTSKKGTEVLTVSNTSAITSMTVTIDVTPSSGETIGFSSEKFSFPKKDFSDTETTSGTEVIYTFTLLPGDTVNAGAGGSVTAVFTTTDKTHVDGNDTWSMTSTSNAVRATLTGAL